MFVIFRIRVMNKAIYIEKTTLPCCTGPDNTQDNLVQIEFY